MAQQGGGSGITKSQILAMFFNNENLPQTDGYSTFAIDANNINSQTSTGVGDSS
tara:strand:- start:138 stop:299 length:162 start_codon:yes stop_codon:yes gene_type:complete